MEDAWRAIQSASPDELRQRLRIVFEDESGKDYGGMAREFFLLLSKELFASGVFVVTDDYRYCWNVRRAVDAELCEFIGNLIGLAIYHHKHMELPLAFHIWRHLQGTEDAATLENLKQFDSQHHRSLQWLLENDVTELGLTFTVSGADGESIPLKDDGDNVPVTNENKQEYVELCVRYALVERFVAFNEPLARGLYRYVPQHLLLPFDAAELDMLLNGQQDLSVEDWRENTNYMGELSAQSAIVIEFWNAVSEMTPEHRALLLRFCTGTDRLPVGGFANLQGGSGPQRFTIAPLLDKPPDSLPHAHTCFNRLELPMDYTEGRLAQLIITAITETTTFDLV